MIDDYFDLKKRVVSQKDNFENLSSKFKEMKSLAIDYKEVKDTEISKLNSDLDKLKKMVEEKGKTLIPLSLYFNRGKIKLEFALAKGKKLWDKRKSKMDKDVKRQVDREMKGRIKK